MAKRSFVEEELARETKSRVDFTKPSIKQQFAQLLHKRRKNVSPNQESLAKCIVEAKTADMYGLVLTPNEARIMYEYPTITDEPESIKLLRSENKSTLIDIYNRMAQESMYEAAIRAMRSYGKGVTND